MPGKTDFRYATSPLTHSLVLVVLALVTGVVCAYAALGLTQLITWVHLGFYGSTDPHDYLAIETLPVWQVILAPVLGGLAVGLAVRWLVPGQTCLDPSDAMQAVREDEGNVPLGAGLATALVTGLSIGSGASLGRYGPSVHLGATLAAWISRYFKLIRAERLTLIGCGVAAAISASFSAPLAGVLFAHEVMLDAFARRGFVAITIASVTGTVVARVHNTNFMMANLATEHIGQTYEYPLFALVGVVGGLLAITFIRGLELSTRVARRLPLAPWARPALAGLVLGVVVLQFPQVIGLGEGATHDAITQSQAFSFLIMLLLAKLIVSCVCLGFGMPGGVFGPALFLGAVLGSAIGQGLTLVDPHLVSSTHIYAIAGMGAVISIVIGAPITTILIVFELTASYALTTAVMIAVVMASLITGRIFPYSWFNLKLLRRGVDVRTGREIRILRQRTVGELVSPDYSTITPLHNIDEAKEILLQLQVSELLIVDEQEQLHGQISLIHILAAIQSGRGHEPLTELTCTPAIILNATDNLDDAMQTLRYFVGISLPVVNESGQLLGVVYQSSVIGAYNDAVKQARDEERGND